MFHIKMLNLWHERADNDKDSYIKTDIAACLNVISGLNTEKEGEQDDEVNIIEHKVVTKPKNRYTNDLFLYIMH